MSEETKPRRPRLNIEVVGGVTVATFTDRKILQEESIQVIGDQLFSLVDDQGTKDLVLNFANVEYMSSAALAKLLMLRKKVVAAGGKLVLCAMDPQLLEVFQITRLDKVFEFCPDEMQALERF